MKLPQKIPVSWILISLLGVATLGFAIGLGVTAVQLRTFQNSYTLNGQEIICTAHKKTIQQLSDEIVSLKQTMEIQADSTESKIKADLTGFLSAYYTIDSQNYDPQDTLDAVSSLVSPDCLAQMTVIPDPHVESIPEGTETFAYRSSFSLDQFFVRVLDTGSARAIALGEVSIFTQWGNNTDSVLLQMDAQYDAEKGRWIVTSFTGMDQVSLTPLTP